jgi:CheY-like chemotaxis protein
MRGITGMDLADALRERRPSMLERVVFMTGGAFTSRASEFLQTYASQCVEKPFAVVDETRRRLAALRDGA